MSSISLIRVSIVCRNCNFQYAMYLQAEDDYGVIHFATPTGQVAFLIDDDQVLREIEATMKRLAKGRKVPDFIIAEGTPRVLNEAVDLSLTGERFYSWGDVPCPNCGTHDDNDRLVPDPTRSRAALPAKRVTLERWTSLPQSQKDGIVSRVLQGLKLDQGYTC